MERVKRNELFDNESVETKNDLEDDEGIFPPSYGFDYNFIEINQPAATVPSHDIPTAPDVATTTPPPETEDKFEFRLFAPSSTTPTTNTKITLCASPSHSDIPLADGHFVKPNRPDDYYFTASLTETELQTLGHQYSTTAVSSAEILLGANKAWPGTSLPWRVISLPASTQPRQRKPSISPQNTIALAQTIEAPPPKVPNPNTAPTHPSTPSPPPSIHMNTRRTKPSKKRRIFLRRRLKLRTKLAGEAKEQAIRDKKTAMNRKNKLRRREKEREKRRKEGEIVREDEEKAGE